MNDHMNNHAAEIKKGERFDFGSNWSRFLSMLDDRRIEEAMTSLRAMLRVESLAGRSFLDVGSGSGLFSLAARRLGARVHSFDYDPRSVACTAELKRRYFSDDPEWVVEQGSILDQEYLSRLGTHEVVYSWGVLHHTGHMWQAFENIAQLVRPNGGLLFISIYNDQGSLSRRWLAVKSLYNRMPPQLRFLILIPVLIRLRGPFLIDNLLKGHPFKSWNSCEGMSRGMSPWIDLVDWVGGYPYEVAKPDEIFHFFDAKGFRLEKLKTVTGLGCNEFVFSSFCLPVSGLPAAERSRAKALPKQ